MVDARYLDLDKQGMVFPIAFENHQRDAYEKFMSQYDPRIGFSVCRENNKGYVNYYLYCGQYRFNCRVFNDRSMPLTFWVRHCDAVTQKGTIAVATKSVTVVGGSAEQVYFLPPQSDVEDRSAKNELFTRHIRGSRKFYITLRHLNRLLDTFDAKSSTEKPRSRYDDEYVRQWAKYTTLSQRKKEFDEGFLIEWEYDGYEVKNRADAATQYVFHVEPMVSIVQRNEAMIAALTQTGETDNDSVEKTMALVETYKKKFAPDNLVEIPLGEPTEEQESVPMVFATIVELTDCGDHCDLTLEFKDRNDFTVKDVPLRGKMKEHPSPDHKNYLSALHALTNASGIRQWEGAERIILETGERVAPIVIDPNDPVTFESKHLTENQKEAVRKAINAEDFLLVQGPPGTGKTTIIAEMVRNFVDRGQRVLICSKGNLAVDNVLEKWIKENRMRPDGHLCVRLGQESRIKLDLLKDYTPAQVTARMQEMLHKKSRAERERLLRQVERPLEQYQYYAPTLELCIVAQRLVSRLQELSALYQSVLKTCRFWHIPTSDLEARRQAADMAASYLYHYVYKELALQWCSAEPSSKERIDAVVAAAQLAGQHLTVATQVWEGNSVALFFTRLIARLVAPAMQNVEGALRDEAKLYTARWPALDKFALLQGNFLREDEELAVELDALMARIQADADPRSVCRDMQRIQYGMDHARQRYARLSVVLKEWLELLGSGKSDSLEQTAVLDSIRVIGSTCMGIMSNIAFREATFDVVIVDEAGQIPIYDLLVPIIRAKKVILIGDHLQLPPMSEQTFARHYAAQMGEPDTKEYKEAYEYAQSTYDVSLFEKLYNDPGLNEAKVMIDRQYRMPKAICTFVSKVFYDNKYKSGIEEDGRKISIAKYDQPIYFYDTCDLPPEQRYETEHNPGCSNHVEAEKCAEILVDLILAIRKGAYEIRPGASLVYEEDGNPRYDIGVISGYSKQVDAIRAKTREKLIRVLAEENAADVAAKMAEEELDKFMISSVDSFQGRDNEIILFSMTRSNNSGHIGFLRDVRRLNVAMTRAKSMLIMVGDSSTLESCTQTCAHNESLAADVYKDLKQYCIDHKFYHKVKEV